MKQNNCKTLSIVKSMIIIAVMVILAAVLFPIFSDIVDWAQERSAKRTAESAYSRYITEHAAENKTPELYLYKTDRFFILLKNGTTATVYSTNAEVLRGITGNSGIAAVDVENGIYQNSTLPYSASPLSEFVSEAMRQIARDSVFPLCTVDGNIAVIGDSTISGYPNYPRLSTNLPVGSGYTTTDISSPGDTLAGQLEKWNALSAGDKASLNYVFVQIGLNDLDKTVEMFREQYNTLIAHIRQDAPNAKLILGTMLPCKKRFQDTPGVDLQIVWNRWKSANEDIKNGYYDCDHIAYLHTDALGIDDNLRSEYDHGDHIHENQEGAKIIVYSWCLATFDNSWPEPDPATN